MTLNPMSKHHELDLAVLKRAGLKAVASHFLDHRAVMLKIRQSPRMAFMSSSKAANLSAGANRYRKRDGLIVLFQNGFCSQSRGVHEKILEVIGESRRGQCVQLTTVMRSQCVPLGSTA